ncbi:MAG: glycoside hydrolase [Bryobacteraceae bacterium]|nr:glycoside hydrolase [Bryobacteraceae bacterium]
MKDNAHCSHGPSAGIPGGLARNHARDMLVSPVRSLALLICGICAAAPPAVLDRDAFRHYVEEFNAVPTPDVASFVPDSQSWEWLKEKIPFLSCPDPDVERTWYYRWWAFRKHIRKTPDGFILTEFLRPVKHATDHNAISCALGHHIAEGRWLRDPRYIDSYLDFWLRPASGGLHRHYHQFSNWTAAAVYERYLAGGRKQAMLDLFEALVLDYETWEKERLLDSGLFWQHDVRDGMEESISGGRKAKNARPSINSYMYGNAWAIARMAQLAGRPDTARRFDAKAAALKRLVEKELWNPDRKFFETRLESGGLANVREAIGFTPWMFGLPSKGRGFEQSWKQLMDPEGFFAPFGPTTAERRHPGFAIAESGDDCQWNGPSWPFATTITLKALANLLQQGPQRAITIDDYFKTFVIYARSHRLVLPDGRRIAFVDENLNPLTGAWHARSRKITKNTFYGRGDHYNHSSFADLLITGLAGLRPRADSTVELHPLIPAGAWDWFCLEGVPYHGHALTILWDRTGSKFKRGAGLRLFVDGRLAAHSNRLGPLRAKLP